jgi:4,5-DOPA dioxygenase extradiol
MQRKNFIKSTLGLMALSSLSSFKNFADGLEEDDTVMPAFFVGHGSPMNALEDNEFTQGWKKSIAGVNKPKAILCVSAHWETKGTHVTAMEKPKTIHDFGGFPQQLFDVQYPAIGSKWLADEVKSDVKSTEIGLSQEWGFDHGTWSVLKHFYPNADIPLVQLSLDYTKDAAYHYQLAKELAGLRKKGVLIVGSGNMVHNFQYARFSGNFNEHFGHDWAIEANATFKKLITDINHKELVNYQNFSKATSLSAPTPEHYLPLLYILALQGEKEQATLFNDAVIGGSFSMTSVKVGD